MMKACLLCEGSVKEMATYTAAEIAMMYGNAGFDSDSVRRECYAFRLLGCNGCGFVIASPAIAGSEGFYASLAISATPYYPVARWEWAVVRDHLSNGGDSRKRLLDIGCGAGEFLEVIRALANIESEGIDRSTDAVNVCRARELRASKATIADFSAERANRRKYEIVTAFHVLEHVTDPLLLMKQAKEMLVKGGRLYITVPNSPTLYESRQLDPKNLPPHHLTRWNVRALRSLARRVGFDVNITASPDSVLRRAVVATWLKAGGDPKASGRRKVMHAIQQPRQVLVEALLQRRIKMANEGMTGDTLLAWFE
jgi:SAM-dependent methyltransferase